MEKSKEYNLVIILLCIFAVSVILNIGLITREITINKDCNCEVNNG